MRGWPAAAGAAPATLLSQLGGDLAAAHRRAGCWAAQRREPCSYLPSSPRLPPRAPTPRSFTPEIYPVTCQGNGDVKLPFGSPEYVGLGFSVFAMLIVIELFGSPFLRNASVIISLLFGARRPALLLSACVLLLLAPERPASVFFWLGRAAGWLRPHGVACAPGCAAARLRAFRLPACRPPGRSLPARPAGAGYMLAAVTSHDGKSYVTTKQIDAAPGITFLWTKSIK